MQTHESFSGLADPEPLPLNLIPFLLPLVHAEAEFGSYFSALGGKSK